MRRKNPIDRLMRGTNTLDGIVREAERRRRRPRKGGGSESVAVEPDHPKRGEGGAAAALEFDDPA